MAIDPETIPEQYKVVFTFKGTNLNESRHISGNKIVAAMPEDGFSLPSSAQWESVFDQGGEALNSIIQSTGASESVFQIKAFDQLAWKGSEPLEVSLNLRLVTFSDPIDDVVKPAFTLRDSTLPSEKGESGQDKFQEFTVVRPVDPSGQKSQINLNIGKWLTFNSIVPTSVSVDWSSTMCTSPKSSIAWPLFADVSFEFMTDLLPTIQRPGFDVEI